MTGLDSILESEMMHDDHVEALTDDFECVDCFMDTEPEYEDDPENTEYSEEDLIDDEEDEDYV